jgi:glycerol uptake facilitator-like aquaporin
MADTNNKLEEKTIDKDVIFSNYQPITSYTFSISLLVELMGTMLFTFIGVSVKNPYLAPFVNGIILAVWIYAAANVSGGPLNPSVSLSVFASGFYPLVHTLMYMIVQIIGGIFGVLLVVGLVPGTEIGMGVKGPGCLEASANPELTNAQLFGWEFLMTFTLVSCVYACGIAKPGHGSFTPLVVGLSLVGCAGAGAQFTGAYLNPARVLGPAAVFKCGGSLIGIYIAAQLAAAVGVCCIYMFISGFGPLSPFKSVKAHKIKEHEALWMWITGSPPKRFRDNHSIELPTEKEDYHSA